MDTFKFSLYLKAEITDAIANVSVELLKKQGKVSGINAARIKACQRIVLCYHGNIPVAIGAIKTKTASDFKENKANQSLIESSFDWELGYFFTDESMRGFGIAPFISKLLLKGNENINLMASTELFPKNGMIRILLDNGFVQIGNPWKSEIHDGLLGLFIRVKKGEQKKTTVSVPPR